MADVIDEKTLDNIAKYGLNVWHILEEGELPRFSYSTGLYKTYNHPEIIIIGLKQELSHSIINSIADDIKSGKRYTAYSWSADILDDFDCYFTEVDKANYDEYVGRAFVYYGGNNFPLLQLIYPTTKGIYPWEDTWPENIKNLQPILGSLNNV